MVLFESSSKTKIVKSSSLGVSERQLKAIFGTAIMGSIRSIR